VKWKTLKEYLSLDVHWDCDGYADYNGDVVPHLTPVRLYLESGGAYEVDRVRADGVLPSVKSGGYGMRYTARVSRDAEENYNRVYYLYYESHGQLGRWRCEDEYLAVDVTWGVGGTIIPTGFYLDGHRYVIDRRGIIMYRMSTRKTDGSGMRYIVKATCRFLRDYNREFSLMLENGGVMTGRWYCEDAGVVLGHEAKLSELDSGGFDSGLVEEEMGVCQVCTRFKSITGAADLLGAEGFEQKNAAGVVYPQYFYPVMVAGESGFAAPIMQWGLERHWASGPILNLRRDKLATRSTFDAIKGNRCVVACGGFYEYQKDGKRMVGDYLFGSGDEVTYLAGLYEHTENGGKFALITTEADLSCATVHDRMPVALRRSEVKAWLSGRMGFAQVGDRRDVSLIRPGSGKVG